MDDAPPAGPRRLWLMVAAAAGAVFLFFVAFFAALSSVEATPEEIARRCREARPVWQNYQEDIKGQIGARAAASWHGEPVRLEVRDGTARLTMRIHGPWADYPLGIPILLRDPQGGTHSSIDAGPPGPERTYHFSLPGATPPPWIEIHYPHNERRLPLSPEGTWQAASPQ